MGEEGRIQERESFEELQRNRGTQRNSKIPILRETSQRSGEFGRIAGRRKNARVPGATLEDLLCTSHFHA